WRDALVSRLRRLGAEDEGEREALLVLVLALLVGVADLADVLGLEEEDLGDALAGVDLGRQRSGVADLDRDATPPLRLQWCYVHYDADARIGRFADTNRDNIPRNLQILHCLRQREAVRRDQAEVAVDVHERL